MSQRRDITTRIPANIVKQLRYLAIDQRTSLAHQIVKAIAKYLGDQKPVRKEGSSQAMVERITYLR
jgi:hypothetical protein